ncbi:MAG TPA: hypothetical protein VFJ22_01160 [Dermatophilaceae bacterium]|nr:hypothetical protein [Dermatophilaceae bacterium]
MRSAKSLSKSSLSKFLAAAATVAATVIAPVALAPAHAAGEDDTPVLLTPKGERETGAGEQNFDKLRDAYYWSRLLAGDEQLTLTEAATLRDQASKQSRTLAEATTGGAARGGTWTNVGNDPTVQVGRTTNTFQAVTGRIGALAVHSDGSVVLGAAQGGVWTYDQGTRVWTSRTNDTDTQSVGALAIAPSNESIVYMGSGEGALSGDSYYGDGVYRSTDGGQTWTKVSGSMFTGQATSAIVVDPANANHLWIATLRGRGGARRTTSPTDAMFGIYESTNGGASWALLKGTDNEIHGATDLVADPQNPQVLWASFWGDGIYRSTDGGHTWSSALGDLPAGNYTEGGTRFALGISRPAGAATATVYAGFDYFDTSDQYHAASVYRTTNDGAHWTDVRGSTTGSNSVVNYCGTQCFYDNVVKPDPNDPNTIYALGSYGYNNSPQSGGIYRSTDGGATWRNLGYDLHPDFHAIAFEPDNTSHLVIGNDGGVWQSFNKGGRLGDPRPALSATDWENLNGDINPSTGSLRRSTHLVIGQFTSVATVPQVPGQYWGGTQDNGTQRKSLVNNRWFDQSSGDGGQVIVDQTTLNQASPSNAAYVYGTYFGISPYRFDPSEVGTFFGNEAIDTGINLRDRAEFYIPWVQNRGNVDQMFLGTYRLYRTDTARAPSSADVAWHPVSADLTSGCTGSAPNGARGCFISAIGVADGGDGVYTASDDGYVYVSPDAVRSDNPTWTRVGVDVLPNRPATQIAVDRSNWRVAYIAYAGFGAATPGNSGHLFKTTDGGGHWADISGGLPDIPMNSVVLDPSNDNAVYVGTDVGAFVTVNGGTTWKRLGTGAPKVAVWQLDYDPSHALLAAGTHGRGVYALNTGASVPALVASTSDSGLPVGPGSTIHYTVTVRNVGNAAATGVTIKEPLPAYTSFVSADSGGAFSTGGGGKVQWSGLTVPAGGSVDVHFQAKISPSLPGSVDAIVSDGLLVKSLEGPDASGSPHTTPIAPAHDVAVSPAVQTGGAHTGSSATYTEHVANLGYQPDSYTLSTTGPWTATTYDATCTTPMTSTPVVGPGAGVDICVKVAVPSVADGTRTDTVLTATSGADSSVKDSATLTTIAVAVDTLLVDGDGNGPDVQTYYADALSANGTAYATWDLAEDPVVPQSYLTAFKNVVWFTGNAYPGPVTPYESELSAFLDNGGRLLMSGQDILDQAAGTTAFVHNYLHIDWDGSEVQNDKATAAVHGVSGSPVSDGIGTVSIDHSVLKAAFEDQITPIAPASAAFTDDSSAPDALSVDTGTYKVVFLAFPLEAYGSATDKADLVHRVLTYFGP